MAKLLFPNRVYKVLNRSSGGVGEMGQTGGTDMSGTGEGSRDNNIDNGEESSGAYGVDKSDR
jgi:hypothetical protein